MHIVSSGLIQGHIRRVDLEPVGKQFEGFDHARLCELHNVLFSHPFLSVSMFPSVIGF